MSKSHNKRASRESSDLELHQRTELERNGQLRIMPATAAGCRSTRDGADRMPVSSIMTQDVVCVRPDLSLGSLTTLLLDRDFNGLPVVDEVGRAIGVVSKTDLVRHHRELEACSSADPGLDEPFERGFAGDASATGTVGDVMTPVVFAVLAEASIASAASIMASRNVHRLPVVDAGGTVVGLLSSIDIVDWVAQGAPERLSRRGNTVHGAHD